MLLSSLAVVARVLVGGRHRIKEANVTWSLRLPVTRLAAVTQQSWRATDSPQ